MPTSSTRALTAPSYFRALTVYSPCRALTAPSPSPSPSRALSRASPRTEFILRTTNLRCAVRVLFFFSTSIADRFPPIHILYTTACPRWCSRLPCPITVPVPAFPAPAPSHSHLATPSLCPRPPMPPSSPRARLRPSVPVQYLRPCLAFARLLRKAAELYAFFPGKVFISVVQ